LVDRVVKETGADVIYAHAPNDTHQDHVATSVAALAAGRRMARVLFYQSPSTTSFNPTVFVDVERTLGDKLASLRAHWSQVMQCAMVDLEAVESGAKYWGSRAKISYAEAFESPRFVWDIGATVIEGQSSGHEPAEDMGSADELAYRRYHLAAAGS
jgi:LmbE family N-acetylglucosaminyl deacetylase